MIKIVILIVTVTALCSCEAMNSPLNPLSVFKTHDVLDHPTSDMTALIVGQSSLGTKCRIIDLSIANSADDAFWSAPKSLVVDAGPATIEVWCTSGNAYVFDLRSTFTSKARFNFVAEAGHAYVTVGRHRCLELRDATLDGHVIACEPTFSGEFVDLTTTDNTAFVTGEVSPEKGNCSPTLGDRPHIETFNLFKVNAGPVIIDAVCIKSGLLGIQKRRASFNFGAETGHTYTFADVDEECMSLLDITSEETVIACEPFEKSQ